MIIVGTKPSPDSKIGIGFKADEEHTKVTLTSISDASIFAGTKLSPGQEIVSINGTPIAGMTTAEVKALLSSIESQITLDVHRAPCLHYLEFQIKGAYDVSMKDEEGSKKVPLPLQSYGVTQGMWDPIVTMFETKLMPAVGNSLKTDEFLGQETQMYETKQAWKDGYLENRHERKVFMMTNQASILHNNISLVSSNLLTLSNALLNPLQILVQLEFSVGQLEQFSNRQNKQVDNQIFIPTALKFTSF